LLNGAETHQLDERPTLTAPAAARAAVAARPAIVPGRVTIEMPPKPPPPVRDAKGRLNLAARALKVTVVLDPAQVAEVTVPNGAGPQSFRIEVGGRRVSGQVNAKGLRKATALIAEHGPERVAVILQGKLGADDVIEECGIVAQIKGPKLAAEENSPVKIVTA
jgi:hypothetical protein